MFDLKNLYDFNFKLINTVRWKYALKSQIRESVSAARGKEVQRGFSPSLHFLAKPPCPQAVEVTPSSPADEMLDLSLGIIGTRRPQPSQNISLLTAFVYLLLLVLFLQDLFDLTDNKKLLSETHGIIRLEKFPGV